jgi:penicillin-binding protein 1A
MAQSRRPAGARREPVLDVSIAPRVSAPDPGERGRPNRRRRKRRRRDRRRSIIGRFFYWSVVIGLWLIIGGIASLAWTGAHLPPIQSLAIPKRPPSIRIVDVHDRLIATRGNMGGDTVTLNDLPSYVPEAFIAIEDRRFYEHYGVDPYGIARALLANVLHRGVSQGGSTITQQLAKNLFLTQERTLQRKLQEVLLALWLERKYSKTRILELYLNRVYFGAGAYGIEQAAQRYFGRSARQLTLAEAAMLAGLVRSPSRLAPTRNFAAAEFRARTVLRVMTDLNFIGPANEKAAMAHPPHIVAQTGDGATNYVADWVMDTLNDVLGHIDEDITIKTSIDADLQADAEKILDDELAKKGAKLKVGQGALVAMTPDGAVRAMVGGRNYAQSQFNRAVAAKRQPGSAFKPFVYLTALEGGLTPDSMREDKPIKINGWRPENYGEQYHGPVSLTQALALSLNSVSVRLTMQFGPAAVIRTAHRLGIVSHLEPNASIALGTSEVSLLELTSAYAPFANGGFADAPHVIERITAGNGRLLYVRNHRPPGRIIDARYVAMMNDMLAQTLVIGTARRSTFKGLPAAGKTGTSQDFRDAWFIGYTAHLVTGVWLGNDDSTPTKHVTGGSIPVDIWSRFMESAHQGVPMAALPDTRGGLLAGVFGSARAAPTTVGSALLPPADVGERAQPARSTSGEGGLDGWLLNRLFGRRN